MGKAKDAAVGSRSVDQRRGSPPARIGKSELTTIEQPSRIMKPYAARDSLRRTVEWQEVFLRDSLWVTTAGTLVMINAVHMVENVYID